MTNMDKRYSYLWNYFAVTDAASAKAVCFICNHTLSYRTTITNLKKHLMTRHPQVKIHSSSAYLQDDDDNSEGDESNDNVSAPVVFKHESFKEKKHKKQHEFSSDSSIVKLKKVDTDYTYPRKMNVHTKKHIDNTLLSMFTKDFHNFTLVEEKGFQAFVNALNSQYKLPDKRTVSEVMLPALYENLKQHVEDALHDGLAITLSVDSWTSNHGAHFIAIKANFLDQQFDVMSVLLECFSFTDQPTNKKLNDILKHVTSEWGINQKITLVVSNCLFESAADEQLQWDYINCVIHSINIIVANSMESISNLLIKVQYIVSCYKHNKFATSELLGNQENLGLTPEDLILSNSTDWYSVFTMLQRFIDLEDFVKTTLYHLDVSPTFLTKEEWKICREIVEIIKPFETFMKSLQEEKYLTSSLAIILSKGLETMLKDLSLKPFHDITHSVLSKCIEETVEQFNYLYSNNILLISTFLDPRFKDVIFESNVKENLKQSITNIISTNIPPSKEQNISKTEGSHSEEDSLSIWKAFQSKASQCRPQASPIKKNSRASIEIQQYLDDGLLPRNENPMQWWKINGHMYPQLKNLMKQNLAATCTSVSCDLFFSQLAQDLHERRNHLTIEEAKLILFINSNQYLLK